MRTFVYFAYGSNMLLERLHKRCKTAIFLGVAVAQGYQLDFGKKSIDGSGKATIIQTGNVNAILYGALFETAMEERPSLDREEGIGYYREDGFVVRQVGTEKQLTVTTYIARPDEIEVNLKPYHWYKQLIQAGAWQAELPDTCQADLRAIESVPDPCPSRQKRREALAVLKASGWVNA
jgi:AIG2-like family